MKKLWFDFTNPPHVNFFLPIIRYFKNKGVEVNLTAREFVETTKLLQLNDLDYSVYGKHGGRGKFAKIGALLSRELQLLRHVSNFDYSLSSNYEAPLASWIKRKPSFVFDDNDISPNWLYAHFAKFVISPSYIDKDEMFKMGIKRDQLLTYNGFKENVYIADYKPTPDFLDQLPFRNFVTVRPENIQASYVPMGRTSIVPVLIDSLIAKGYNVLYLPRYESDKAYVRITDNLFIPNRPLSGLDVCYYSNAILTGAGTFSREAAVMGTPAVSFFAGDRFLGVDKVMFSRNMVYYSRNVNDIVNFVDNSQKKEFNRQVSISVQSELFDILDRIIQ